MKICGLNKTTLLDYPGCVAATIFLGGCNFRCPFCHNGDLVLQSGKMPSYDEDEVFRFLQKRKNVLEGVCITGGEPTLHRELPFFVRKIKELGYMVKLDTNGSNPDMVRTLIEEKLVDYIAMDIKAPVCDYDKVSGASVDIDAIKMTVELLKEGKIPYEFRTTIVKELHSKASVLEIGRWISGAENYYLQSYQETEKNICQGFSPVEKEILFEIENELRKYLKNVKVRGVE